MYRHRGQGKKDKSSLYLISYFPLHPMNNEQSSTTCETESSSVALVALILYKTVKVVSTVIEEITRVFMNTVRL